jgi:diguanylate cyclase (GGDEF)-like protein
LAGAFGWAVIAWSARGGAWPSPLAALLFLAVVVGARLLAFPLGSLVADPALSAGEDGKPFSLESAMIIAATACLGIPATALGSALVWSGDALCRGIGRPSAREASSGHHLGRTLAHAFYFGGVSGGLIAISASLVGVSPATLADGRPWLVPTAGAVFLVLHGLVASTERWLSGKPLGAAIRRGAVGASAEATLLPLASGIAIIFSEHRPAAFVLLSATYLFVNFGFNRLAGLLDKLRRRVIELETLNRTAHAASGSLEAPRVLAALLEETQAALPSVSRLEVILEEGGRRHHYAPSTAMADAPDALTARSRVSVPIRIYDEIVGSLEAESLEADAFGPDERRLLDAISGQAATAVQNARLYTLANFDGLTGLYCRRYFDRRLAEEIERARRFGTSFALVMLDLDNFKRLNDARGHQAGDLALREVARIAEGQLRGVDLAARYGGEELAFLLPRTSLAEAHAVAERIREHVALHCFIDGGTTLRITASLGVAGWAEAGVDDPTSLVRRADAALYRAKAHGKNRVEVDLTNFQLSPSLAPIKSAS